MVCEFLADAQLRQHALLVTEIAKPLEDKYTADLQAQNDGLESMILWNAERSKGCAWWNIGLQIIASSCSPQLVAKLGVTGPCKPPLQFDSTAQWMVASRMQHIALIACC